MKVRISVFAGKVIEVPGYDHWPQDLEQENQLLDDLAKEYEIFCDAGWKLDVEELREDSPS